MPKKINRVKSDANLIPITGWSHADALLRDMGDHQLAIAGAEAEARRAIDAAAAARAAAVIDHHEAIKRITQSLEAFAGANRNDFSGRKSLSLNYGTLGWRLSTSISIKTDKTIELIKQVFAGKMALQFINIRETPDKEALAKLTDEQLASIKASRTMKDTFFVEPAIPGSVDYGDPPK
jgi:phage host-nuclease inhibitor protein Gam